MTYARARLWIGITTVGFWVVLATVALVERWPSRFLPVATGEIPTDVLALAAVFLIYLVLSIPSDLLGGLALPRRHGRSPQSTASYFGHWLRGALLQFGVLMGISLTILIIARTLGSTAALAVVALLGLLLVVSQAWLGRMLAGASRIDVGQAKLRAHLEDWRVEAVDCELWESRDPGFTGGIVGLPGRERLVLPATWIARMGSAPTAAHLVRRLEALRSGARSRGVLVALLWNWIGFALATRLPDADLISVAGLVTVALGSTLWSFLGLLLLPSVSRPAVYITDRRALERGVPEEHLNRALRIFDQMQDDEPARAPWIERIFHPLPSLENRLEGLHRSQASIGAWNAARLALFLSWSTLGLLSRAVHCNAGRPELWVLLPAD